MPEYANNELEKVVTIAKGLGLHVWAFKTNGPIRQVFFDDGKTYGTASAWFGLLNYGTCHEPNESCGTSIGLAERERLADELLILQTLHYAPQWCYSKALHANIVKKCFQDHIKGNTLQWYEL